MDLGGGPYFLMKTITTRAVKRVEKRKEVPTPLQVSNDPSRMQ